MRIVIDIQGAQSESFFRGIGSFTLSLVTSFLDCCTNHEVFIILNASLAVNVTEIKKILKDKIPIDHIKFFYFPSVVRAINPENLLHNEVAQILYEYFILQLQPDIYFVPSLFEGYIDDAIVSHKHMDDLLTVVVAHDLIPLKNSKIYLSSNKNYKNFYKSKIDDFLRFKKYIAISECVKMEVCSLLNISENDVEVVHSGVDNKVFNTHIQIPDVTKKFNISSEFIFYCGAADERKNLSHLIQAYAGLSDSLKDKTSLVFAGKIEPAVIQNLTHIASTFGVKKTSIRFLGFIDTYELVALYRRCSVFVFPSWDEGFGLPVVEAMQCGAPVICSNCSSLPEIVGCDDALFDPFDVGSIATKITQVLTDEDFRTKLIQHGINRSKVFSWSNTANNYLKIFEKNFTEKKEKQLKKNNVELHQEEMLALAQCFAYKNYSKELIADVAQCIEKNRKEIFSTLHTHNVLLEGPFDSSYSLAIENRELALALADIGEDVSLFSMEGYGKFKPNENFLRDNPRLAALFLEDPQYKKTTIDVVTRNLYPPRVDEMYGTINTLNCYGWEETGFPQEWVNEFNLHLDGILAISNHVKKILIDNGVTVPVAVSGTGITHWERITSDISFQIDAKSFKFLHVSSCFPRKGIKQLLAAYAERFSNTDDVSLIIKTFPNPHNFVKEYLKDLEKDDTHPHVVLIENDLSAEELKALYEKCDVLVAPSLAEGFCLPIAEAMLSGLPSITTNWGGQKDFCNEDNSWLIDYDFEQTDSHFGLNYSVWAVPECSSLASAMQAAFFSSELERKTKAHTGQKQLLNEFTWEMVAQRHIDAFKKFSIDTQTPVQKIGWISTWGSRCGIAEYSALLIREITDCEVCVYAPSNETFSKIESSCNRCWMLGKEINQLNVVLKNIRDDKIQALIVQFNYGFFNHKEFSEFICSVSQHIPIIIMMHATVDPEGKKPAWNFRLEEMVSALHHCQRILVHTVADLNRLKQIGLIDNVALFPHAMPATTCPISPLQKNKIPVIATYGFCLPHKGILQIAQALSILKQENFSFRFKFINALYPIEESELLLKELKQYIKQHGLVDFVNIIYDFLPQSECAAQLQEADLIIFPYQQTSESSSAAVRYGLATAKAVAVTPVKIFDELRGSVFRFSGFSPQAIADGIKFFLLEIQSHSDNFETVSKQAEKLRESCSATNLSKRLINICTALCAADIT